MAKISLAALRFARNADILEITKFFECIIDFVGSDSATNDATKMRYLSAIEEIIYFGYEAVKETQNGIHRKSYLKYFYSYVHYSNLYFGWYSKPDCQIKKIVAENPTTTLAQSLIKMFLLAIDAYAKTICPCWHYKRFALALSWLCKNEVIRTAGMAQNAAKLAKMLFNTEVCNG